MMQTGRWRIILSEKYWL